MSQPETRDRDPRQLDARMQCAIYESEHNAGSVSAELTAALVARTPIIIVTIQTIPFGLKAIATSRTLKRRNFAIIADEAHSSQTGSTANKLTKVQSSEKLEDIDDGCEFEVGSYLRTRRPRAPIPGLAGRGSMGCLSHQ